MGAEIDSSACQVPQDFVEAVAWRPSEPFEFLLYGIRQVAVAPPAELNLRLWPLGTNVRYSALIDERWTVAVELYEIRSPALPHDLELALKDGLGQLSCQGLVISWYMFEGAFGDIGRLFSPWQATQTYGLAFNSAAPVVRIRQPDRTEPGWLTILERAAAHLYSVWPEVRSS
jgi:hypothetical protein